MKKFYLLLILLFFSMQFLTAQTTETFEASPINVANFTSGTKTFNLTSSYQTFTVYGASPNLGYNGSNRFIQVNDDAGALSLGQTGTITAASGTFKVSSLWIYLTGDSNQNPNSTFDGQPGSVTFIGKLAGVTKFSVVKTTTGIITNYTLPGNGFTLADFTTLGGTNNSNVIIDQLDIKLSSNYDYFAVDNFAWNNGAVAPTVTTTAATTVKSVSATLAGDVTADGGDANIERGIVWATTVNPTTANTKVQMGTGTGTFSNVVTGLPPATTIHFRAYAINSGGTSYGSDLTFTTGAALSTSSISQTNVSCNGGTNGTASVVVTGGSTNYTYSWSPSGGTNATASGLGVGNYTVTITDSELTQITRIFNITQPLILNGTPSTTAVSCFGGSNGTATVVASGGTSGYTYLWSNGATTATATGLLPGTYSVTITDANSCTRTINNILVGQPSAILNGTASTTAVSCFGGSNGTATILASGGTSGYTYLWSNGATTATATGLTAGTYSVTITDANSCTRTINNILVGQPSAILNGTPSTTAVSCFGGSNGTATILASGGTPSYTYLWSNGATTATASGLAAGTYSVTITDANSCTRTINNISVGQPASALTGTTSTTPVSCNGGTNGTATVTPIGGTSTYTYLWSNGATSATASGLAAGNYSVTITDANSCTFSIINIVVTQPPVLNGTPAVTNVSCNGGSNGVASIIASGGTPGYTYLWSNGATTSAITGLAAGTYSVTITDAKGCTKIINNITVGQPSVLTASQGAVNNVSCNGGSNGSATVSVSGGIPAYTYSWSPAGGTAATASGLSQGTYTVTVTDANSCQTTQSFTISEPAPFSVTTSQTDILCNGGATGSATVNVTGGTGAYTYSWAPSGGTAATATGLTAGTYTVTIQDANLCQTTRSFTIIQPSTLVATPISQTNIGCRGEATGSATVNATGGTGAYTYSWAPSGGTAATATGLTAGTYTVTIKDANLCQTTQSFTITQPAAILSASTASTGVSCFGGSNGVASVIASGGTPGYTYLWAPLGGTSATITGRPAGNYTCTITDANGCTLVKNITISTPTQIIATASKTDVSCNGGTNGTATVSVSGGTAGYTYSWSPTGGTAATASGLAAGTYTVTITDANTCQTTANVTIGQPAVLAATTAKTDVLCNGGATGTASVNVTGGNGNYTYVWSPSGGTAATATGLTAGNYSVLITDAVGCTLNKNFTINQPSILAATTSQINATCVVGGQASVTPSGGTTPYTYLWSNGETTQTVTNLAAGNYSATITDANGCAITKNFTITTINTLVATVSQTDVLCNGSNTGTATVVASGAPGPFTYVWAPTGGNAATASGLTAGNYSVTITSANGCSIVKNFTITEPTAIVVTPSQTNISCNGGANGSASVVVTGGTGVYTYAWAPSGGTAATASGLTAGTYTVTISDANLCQTTQSFTLTEPAALVATPSQTNVSCNGGSNGSATVSVTGGTGAYTYIWSPTGGTAATASGLAAGTYTVTVQDANTCQTTATVTITEPAILAATTSQVNVSCSGQSDASATVTVTGGTGAYTYAWSPSGGTAATATGLSVGNYSVLITDAVGCSLNKNFTINQPSILAATTSQINATCVVGGQASVTPSGGTTPYTYLWSNGETTQTVTNLAAGNYSTTITDANGCAITKNFTITTINTLVATVSQTDVLCNGSNTGTATVVPSGAPGPFTYVWAPTGGNAATATGLTAGNYSVTITSANGCSIVKNFTITEPTAIVVTPSQTNISCNGGANGSASVVVTGGTGAYTYVWAPSGGTAATASGLTAGTYTVTISDANLCQTTQSFTLTEPAALVATPSQTNVSCNGGSNGSATVSVTGGTGAYTYIWSPTGGTAATATGLAAGTYTVTVTDANSCTRTETITISQPDQLIASIGNQTAVSCKGENNGSATINVTGGTGTYNYVWSPSGGTAATATELSPGNYNVTVTDANGCTTSQNFVIAEPAQLVASVGNQNNVSCFNGTNGSASVVVTGGTGAYTYAWAPSGGTAATASGLTAGTYTVTISDANLCQTTQSFTLTEPAALVATPSQTNVSCNGGSNGSATVSVTGGTGAYTYIWSPTGGTAATATGLAAGTYTVTITDANTCQTTATVTITEPAILAATTSQVNVSCSGQSDASATVTVTGGTGAYTYAWSPSGGTAATATGLSAGNYSVLITDANSCTLTQNVTITTTPDATAPIPDVATLPAISNTCSVLSAQIPVPTATDNCAGIINATTTDPLNYTAVGNYVIKWTYDDGNGNTSSQNQNVNVTASPLDQVTFANADFTYNGSVHTIEVANLPAGASVVYATTPSTGTLNGATNAGTYTVTAIVSPSVSTPNCSPITLTAQLTINKAAQQITFGAIPAKILGVNNNFNLEATSNSGLPIRYSFTYTSALPPANVSATGLVNLLRSGSLTIVAHQDGNENYLPAADVSQVLVIKNNDITVSKITIGTKVFENPAKEIKYLMECGENNVNVAFTNETGATFSPSANFTITPPKPGIYTQNVTVTSQDGTATATYVLTIEKPFGFYDIVHQKFNNILLINNNPQTNGGYEFVSYQWFKNGQLVGTGQYYSAGDDLANSLDKSADFSAKMTTKDGKTLQTCSTKISTQKSSTARLYPNPIQTGQVITVEADFPAEELENMQISLYTVSGQLVKTLKSSTVKTEVQLPDAESNMYVVVIETPNIKKTLKIIVNK